MLQHRWAALAEGRGALGGWEKIWEREPIRCEWKPLACSFHVDRNRLAPLSWADLRQAHRGIWGKDFIAWLGSPSVHLQKTQQHTCAGNAKNTAGEWNKRCTQKISHSMQQTAHADFASKHKKMTAFCHFYSPLFSFLSHSFSPISNSWMQATQRENTVFIA